MSEFYKEHWREIEPERLQRYERMFAWRPELAGVLERMSLRAGLQVLDFGCGPGFVAEAMADAVGPAGRVVGVDLNQTFIERAQARNSRRSDIAFVTSDGQVPAAAASFDRALCKNVLEYVTDAQATLNDLFRALKPSALLHVSDSDWGFLLVHPWTQQETARLFAAAAVAFREPLIGRRLPGMLQRAGFVNIDVQIQAGADREGRMRPVLENMANYARGAGGMPEMEVADLLQRADTAIASGDFMMVLPQFSIVAHKPSASSPDGGVEYSA